MDNVIGINSKKPHREGLTKCLSCKHEWVAVAPVGTKWLDCPACSKQFGHAVGLVAREGLHWQCKCGCQLFCINTTGPYCIECGEYVKQ